jgi:putative endonuclease
MAISTEKQIKKWSRVKKEALINEKYELLPNLAKKKFRK